jgi:hypothetical protein
MCKSVYASQSVYSEPGPYREILMRGGDTPELISRWISSFIQHPRGGESKERGFTLEQTADLELRSVTEILTVAAERCLLEGDTTQIKVGGLCRDFAILAASSFRARGIPARLCEWHDGQRWKRLDVEFAATGGASFNTLDVPREQFLTAGEAWFRIKGEPGLASRFGVSSLNLGGEWFIAGSLFRDLAALRRLELKPWDYWGLSENLPSISTDWSQQSWETLNQIASRLRSADVEGVAELEALADWPLPKQVISFPQSEPVVVVLQNV